MSSLSPLCGLRSALYLPSPPSSVSAASLWVDLTLRGRLNYLGIRTSLLGRQVQSYLEYLGFDTYWSNSEYDNQKDWIPRGCGV